MPFTPARHPGILHHFAGRLFAFEYTAHRTPSTPPPNTILFLGGMADDIGHPSYPGKLPPHLPSSWSLAELHIRSSGQGWTTSSIARDATDVEKAVAYFRALHGRAGGSKIVLMGHSTGAQVCMEYVLGRKTAAAASAAAEDRFPPVDGIILQAGVSDREGLAEGLGAEKFDAALRVAREWVSMGRGEDILPQEVTGNPMGPNNPCARRWVDLTEVRGADDYFSSDLGSEVFARTFGRLDVPVCCLLSEKDEHMPSGVDKAALLRTWREAVRGGGGVWDESSGIVTGASHNFNKSEDGVVADLAKRVAAFVKRVESGDKGGGKL